MEVTISKLIREKFNYINNEEIVDIINFISDTSRKSKGILVEKMVNYHSKYKKVVKRS